MASFEDDSELIFDSPPASASPQKRSDAAQRFPESPFDTAEAREAALRQELENIRKINQVVEGVVDSLDKAKSNMETVSKTVDSASSLLQTWTRILSQSEHNQRLILNPRWQGATRDLSEIENDEIRRQQDAQRRQYEEQQRREAAARKAEEDERKRAAATPSRGPRGRGTGRIGSRPTSGASGSATAGYGRVRGARGTGRAGTTGRAGSTTARGRGVGGRGTS
ncbi:hypothetical protein BT63DRAFT_428751 [Microthyrium microscopicum]|uniref:DASH complex subunit DUO1 n=1 Tax=Microthyrium microscopicum TaxID=703497 RepID=A0A6A6U4C8_9PEZI|nr:hypothetical protein BT63DRAFT_428751 [Microthyrium microscopicum]